MVAYGIPFAESAAGVFAATSTLSQAQAAASRSPQLLKFVTRNASLSDDVWWDLMSRPKLPADRAAELAVCRPLSADMAAAVARDRRPSVVNALLSAQVVSGAALDSAVKLAGSVTSIACALAMSPGVPSDVAVTHLSGLESYRRARALAVQAPRMSDEAVLGFLLDPGFQQRALRFYALPRVLDLRRSLTAAFVSGVASSDRSLRIKTALLTHAAESRVAPADVWLTVRSLLGDEPKWAKERALLLAAVAGNPGTPSDGVQWALESLAPMAGGFHALSERERDRVKLILAVRCEDLEPVPGDWSAPSTLGQLRSLDLLAADGVVSTMTSYHEHPRAPRAVAVPEVGVFSPDLPARRPQADYRDQARFNARMSWEHDVVAGAPVLDAAFADADVSTLSTFFTLALDWDGSIGDLVAASTAL